VKPNIEQTTLSVNGETECIQFLRSEGANIDHLFLSSVERWRVQEKIDWDNPDSVTRYHANILRNFEIREKFINKYGFAILSREAIEAMRPYAPLLELGAGSGYWTYELRKYGVDCIATDTMNEEFGHFKKRGVEPRRWDRHYGAIEKLNSVEAVRKYPNRNLLIVWPSLNEPWAADALDIFTGKVVIYMGEGHGNACADDRFHELLDERFADQEEVRMPHFEHSYDRQLLICKQPQQLTKG
jgi:hypothetical protein